MYPFIDQRDSKTLFQILPSISKILKKYRHLLYNYFTPYKEIKLRKIFCSKVFFITKGLFGESYKMLEIMAHHSSKIISDLTKNIGILPFSLFQESISFKRIITIQTFIPKLSSYSI